MLSKVPNHSGTKCPHCQETIFELTEDIPSDSTGEKPAYRYVYLRCAKCKTFLSAFDYAPIGELIDRMAKKMGVRFITNS